MLAHTDLHRSMGKLAIDLHRAMNHRAHAGDDYRQAVRTQMFQFDITGKVGTFPVEKVVKIPFDIIFAADPGMAWDSQLTTPHAHFAFEMSLAPPGLIPYAHISTWLYDDDYDYKGAKVNIGIHCPSVELLGVGSVSQRTFVGRFHATFTGYGAPWDPDGTSQAGGEDL